jgi:AraC-like DNA-binding protein
LSFLRERRFEVARARLLASSAATVTDVAVASGFEHLGRFSVEYKKRYGESPTQTLRRGRDLSRSAVRVPMILRQESTQVCDDREHGQGVDHAE